MTFDPTTLPDRAQEVYQKIMERGAIADRAWTAAAYSAIRSIRNGDWGEPYIDAAIEILFANASPDIKLSADLYDLGIPVE